MRFAFNFKNIINSPLGALGLLGFGAVMVISFLIDSRIREAYAAGAAEVDCNVEPRHVLCKHKKDYIFSQKIPDIPTLSNETSKQEIGSSSLFDDLGKSGGLQI